MLKSRFIKVDPSRTRYSGSSRRNQISNWPLFSRRNVSNPWSVDQARFGRLKSPAAFTNFLMGAWSDSSGSGHRSQPQKWFVQKNGQNSHWYVWTRHAPWSQWNFWASTGNGANNIQWYSSRGGKNGPICRVTSGIRQRSARSFTWQMPLNRYIGCSESWQKRKAFSLMRTVCWNHCIWD